MKKYLAVTTAAIAVLSVHVAIASASCTAGQYRYAGFEKDQIVSDGNKLNSKITFNSGTYYGNGSHVLGWTGVQDTIGDHWLQAGIWDDANYGLSLYVEYQTDAGYFHTPAISASSGTAYTALIQKVSAGVWDAVVGSHGYDNISISGMTTSKFMGESYNGTTSCNAMNYSWAQIVPWTTSQFDVEWDNSPYSVSVTGMSSFTSSG